MSELDRLIRQQDDIFSTWGLNEIPFSESADALAQAQLHDVFTGRRDELRQALMLFRSRQRRRLFLSGWYGIGKTAFMLELLTGLAQRGRGDTLAIYTSLPSAAVDLETCALISLARTLEDDSWAQEQLSLLGLPPRQTAIKRKEKGKATLAIFGYEHESETLPAGRLQYPALSFEALLERALRLYGKVIIAIDDLEKQEPARTLELLRSAQGLLKGGASFILTGLSGQPAGLTRDILARRLGLFDLAIELTPIEQPLMQEMLVNYLNSARPRRARRAASDPRAIHPFVPETAEALCVRSYGIPRYFNRLGTYVLTRAGLMDAALVTPNVFQLGLDDAARQLRGRLASSPALSLLMDVILEKGGLAETQVSLDELERLGVRTFAELMPWLNELVELDLLRLLPNPRELEFTPSPLLSGGG